VKHGCETEASMHYLQLLFTDKCRIDDLGSSKNLKLECVVSQEGAKDLARAVSMVRKKRLLLQK
jgi:hypothetical protein